MKYKGKAITGSSLFAILLIICFASLIVAAVAVISTPFTVDQTVKAAPTITVTTPTTPGAVYTGAPTTYSFTAAPNMVMTNVQMTVTVTKDGNYVSGDIVSNLVTLTFEGLTADVVGVLTTGTWTTTLDIGTVGPGANPASIAVTYANAGIYHVTVSMTGTAPPA